MTPSEELRERLEEQDVEWTDHGEERHTWYYANGGARVMAFETNAGHIRIEMDGLTPKQAIFATLGIKYEPDAWHTCPKCGCVVGYEDSGDGYRSISCEDYRIPFNFCPKCGKKVADA